MKTALLMPLSRSYLLVRYPALSAEARARERDRVEEEEPRDRPPSDIRIDITILNNINLVWYALWIKLLASCVGQTLARVYRSQVII